MAGLWILVPLLGVPAVLFIGNSSSFGITTLLANCHPAWLVLSSCLGSSVRSRIARSSISGQQPSFGRNYAMNLSSGAGSGWESIEMENMLNPEDEFDDTRR